MLGGLALAFQVFAGHLQDTLLTIGLVGLYGLYRAATERGRQAAAARWGCGRPGRRWVSCSRPCSGFPPRNCSIARLAPGAIVGRADLRARGTPSCCRPWSFAKPMAPALATPTGWTAFTPTMR